MAVKVCHITNVHKRYDVRIFQKECISLAEADYDVSLVVCDDQDDEERDGVHIVSVHYEPKSRMDRMRKAAKLVYQKALALDADIYQIHDPELLPYAKKLAKHGKKVIFDSHEIYSYIIALRTYLPQPLLKIIERGYTWYEKKIVSCLDAVIVPCTVAGVNYFEHIAKRTIFIDNLPKTNETQFVPYEKKPLPVKICYVGTLGWTRGLKEMFIAAKETDTTLILAGPFRDGLQDEIKHDLENEKIDYRGYVSRTQAEQIYAESQIGLSIIHNKGQIVVADNLPTKIYEYMFAGMPVVISRQHSAEKFIEKYKVGILVDPDNQTEINGAINYLKTHPDVAKEMGELGRKIVMEKYNWDQEKEKLIQLYKELSSEID